jgi:hypothetical protein
MARLRLLVGTSLAAGALLCTGAATAKDFSPGDLRVCGAKRCVPIVSPTALRAFSAFYYGGGRVAVVSKPRIGAAAFEIRSRNGYPAGLVASAKLDRTLVYGLNCGRFRGARWYRLPARAALEVRRLSRPLEPLRVPRATPPPSC